jgi:lipocalin-like protein
VKLISLICGFALLTILASAQSNGRIPPELVGTWRLVSIEGEGGRGVPTDRPTGTIVYDNTGHMAVQIAYSSKRGAMSTVEEKSVAFDTYTAYYGTYAVNASELSVVHHIEGSLRPSDIGQDFFRYYEFKGPRLVISNPADGKGGNLPRKDITRFLTWERVK